MADHPVPTERRVLITEMDTRHLKIPVEEVLASRGIDLSQPYRQEPNPDGEGTLYIQEISSKD